MTPRSASRLARLAKLGSASRSIDRSGWSSSSFDQQRRHHRTPNTSGTPRRTTPCAATSAPPSCSAAASAAPSIASACGSSAGPSRSARSLRASGRTGCCRAAARGGRCGAPPSCARRRAGARPPTACRRAPVPGRNAGRSTRAGYSSEVPLFDIKMSYCAPVHIPLQFSGYALCAHSKQCVQPSGHPAHVHAHHIGAEGLCINAHRVGAVLSLQPHSIEAHCNACEKRKQTHNNKNIGDNNACYQKATEAAEPFRRRPPRPVRHDRRRRPCPGSAGGVPRLRADNIEKVVVTARRRQERCRTCRSRSPPSAPTSCPNRACPTSPPSPLALPNTTLKASRATNTTLTAFIRGVGQADPLAGFEAGVGIYLDDIYLARPQGAVADIYDVERIEVLRGPQGTLYGRNTIGGAVKYVTRKLAPKTDVRLKGTLGNYKERDGVITASTPVSRPAARRRHRGALQARRLRPQPVHRRAQLRQGRAGRPLRPNGTPTPTCGCASPATSPRTIRSEERPPPDRRPHQRRADPRQRLRHPRQPEPGPRPRTGSAPARRLGHARIPSIPTLSVKSITARRKDKSYAPIDFDSLPAPTWKCRRCTPTSSSARNST
jgi:hypothetical protein